MNAKGQPRAAAEIEVEAHRFAEDGLVPNNPRLPALIYRRAWTETPTPRDVERVFGAHGWRALWVWRVFDYHHYHPDAHEALACVAGAARLLLGGPAGAEVAVEAGDVAALPAGTGHKLLSMTPDFAMCGAYPVGQEGYATIRAEAGQTEADLDAARRAIARTPLPSADPLHGDAGPLVYEWNKT